MTSPLSVELVPVLLVDNVFARCAEGLGKSLAAVNSGMDIAYLFQQCRSGGAMLVIVHDGAETISAAMVVRVETRQECPALATLGLWCSQKGDYSLLKAKQDEIARMVGVKHLISGARVSPLGHCGYLRKHPTAKILSYTLMVEVDSSDA